MKKIFIISLLHITCFNLTAQTIQRSVIGSAGKVSTSGAYKISATVGEVATNRFSIANGLSLHQGFQQNMFANNPLPITGLEFYAQRLSPSLVHLQWQTLTEINNKGFYIERKLENETDFSNLDFVESKADQGNSQTVLKYDYKDINSFTGSSYYRIKQEDIDGKNSYSLIRVIYGEQSNQLSLQVWPVPSKGYVHIQLIGGNRTNEIAILDAQGKVVKSIIADNQIPYRLDGLQPGVYFVVLKSYNKMVQKIIIE